MDKAKARDTVVDKVKTLPTLPNIIYQLLQLLQYGDVDIEEVVEVITYDLAISTRLLKVANSAYYGFMKKITTVRHAISVLGFRQVKSLALGITVFETMKGIGGKSSIDHKQLWLHSIGCGMAARLICRFAPAIDPETAFTASLLHDIGKLVMDGFYGTHYQKVMEKVSQGVQQFTAEEQIFGFDHGEVGGWLCERWKLPSELTYPIMYHHHIQRAQGDWKTIAAIVHCADYLSKRLSDETAPSPSDAALRVLAVRGEELDDVLKELAMEKESISSLINAIE